MTFSLDVCKRAGAIGAVALTALLAACGGGEQKEQFTPGRIVAFGDENTLIAPNGYQYTTNNETRAGVTPCTANPAWIQIVALSYGFTFGECAGEAPRATAQMKATLGATVASTRAAINTFHAATPLVRSDLVTLMAGTHDVVTIYESRTSDSAVELDALAARGNAAGYDYGVLVLDVIDLGPRVAFASVPNLGLAPISVAATAGDTRRGEMLAAISNAFNKGLAAGLASRPNGGGRQGALIDVRDMTSRYYFNFEGYYSLFGDRINSACVVDNTASPMVTTPDAQLVTDCKTSVVTSVRSGYNSALWAGRFHFGALTHWQIGADAFQRIRNNPL